MSDRVRNIMVGLTAIVGLGGVAVMLVLFGWVPEYLDHGYTLSVDMPDALGLSEGARVRLRGIDVGKVKKVALSDKSTSGVLITAMIRPDVRIPAGAVGLAESQLLGGTSALFLDVSKGQPDRFLPTDGSAVIPGKVRSFSSDLADKMDAAVARFGGKFEKIAENFDQLSAEWVLVGKNVNQLIEPRTVGEVDDKGKLANLSSVMARTDQRIKELREALEGVNKWVSDNEVREDFRAVVSNVKQASGKANTLMDETRENVARLSLRYAKVADDLSLSLDSLRKAMDKASTGEGTVGKLLNDPALYDNLNDAAQRIAKAAGELRLLVEKFQTEGVPLKLK